MKEDFLHYIWQHQYFDKTDLVTAQGEPVQVLRPGLHNTDAGPDFLQAQVKVGEVTWNGSVEIHLKASDWARHRHHQDPRYDQVILHLVWENDGPVFRTDGSPVPAVFLAGRVNRQLLGGYEKLKTTAADLPCGPFLEQVPALPRLQMLDRMLMERLEQKANRILAGLEGNQQDWEASTYQALCANFGFKINQEPFQRLSKILPLAILRRHRTNLLHLEALLLGQAGFLENEVPGDAYLNQLRQEYLYLHHKYKLEPSLRTSDWNFLRLRPANFPTVRLAQLAALLHNKPHLFSCLTQCQHLKEYRAFLSGPVSGYWQFHYLPGKQVKSRIGNLGQVAQNNLLTNTVVPLLFAYSRHLDKPEYQDQALALLEALPPEKNRITQVYETRGFAHKSAADSQAFLQLHPQYCVPRKCLNCSLGHYLLKSFLPAT